MGEVNFCFYFFLWAQPLTPFDDRSRNQRRSNQGVHGVRSVEVQQRNPRAQFMRDEGALANDAPATVPCDKRGGCGSVVLCERDGTETFGRTTQHQCWTLPSPVKFWVTTYDAGENLAAKGTPCGGRPWGLRGCCLFLETAETTELQKFQNEDEQLHGRVNCGRQVKAGQVLAVPPKCAVRVKR